ncbi:hypothetical protein EON64_03765 [archaeon]|nr:MAG: hypothetical protein EON64_03765 [archaeon]
MFPFLTCVCGFHVGSKSGFELEVYASEKVTLTALPEAFTRSIAGEWIESTAGGSHIYGTWKKNPRFLMRFHNPVNTDAPVRCRITVARIGSNNHWHAMSRKDTVGCMIGFYIFHVKGTEQTQIYESTFLPDEEVSTDSSFTLPQLAHAESYMIMPTTFGDGKCGAFVLSVLSEYEIHLAKDK